MSNFIFQDKLDGIILGREKSKQVFDGALKELLEALMQAKRYNQSKAAMSLGVSRGTMRKMLKEHFGSKYVGTRDEK